MNIYWTATLYKKYRFAEDTEESKIVSIHWELQTKLGEKRLRD
jgi:hypothetical protein